MEGGNVRFCWCGHLGLITLFVLYLVTFHVKTFFYIPYVLGPAMHFVWSRLDICVQSYGRSKLNGSV